MDFNNKFDFEWGDGESAEPSANLREKGFTAGYKPPAGVFNWFWSKVIKAITELQSKFGSHADNKGNPHEVTAEQLGLENVDNTKDSEKNVAFASEAGVGRKVKYPFTFRLNGGKTEGTDLWTYDGSTSRSVNLTPEKLGSAKNDLSNVDDETFKEKIKNTVVTGTPIVTATSTDGATYTATVEDITELYNGLEVIIVPNIVSKSQKITLNLNGLGDIPIRRPLSFSTFVATSIDSDKLYFLSADTPCRLMYHANYTTGGIWLMADKQKTSAQDLYGIVPVEDGGTGGNTAETARTNLEVAQAIEDSTYKGCYYRMVDGVQKWLNPPMVADVSYRTVERDLNANDVEAAMKIIAGTAKNMGIEVVD